MLFLSSQHRCLASHSMVWVLLCAAILLSLERFVFVRYFCLLPMTLVPLGATPRLVSIEHMAYITVAARFAAASLAFDTDLLDPPGDVHAPYHTPLFIRSFHG